MWVLVSWAKTVPPAAHKQSIHCFDQHSTSATHISNPTLHDTQDTHMHTCTYTLIPSVVFIHLLMRTCIISQMIHAGGEACLSGVQQTECCHMVESNTTDESCRECAEHADRDTGRRRDGETKTERGMQKEKRSCTRL